MEPAFMSFENELKGFDKHLEELELETGLQTKRCLKNLIEKMSIEHLRHFVFDEMTKSDETELALLRENRRLSKELTKAIRLLQEHNLVGDVTNISPHVHRAGNWH